MVSLLLVFRELGVWWSDAVIWPLALAAFGVALLWTLSRPEPEPDGDDGGEGELSARSLPLWKHRAEPRGPGEFPCASSAIGSSGLHW